MEWTENKTKLLIEEVDKHPCLYESLEFMFVLAIYCLRNCAVAEAILLRKKVAP